MTQHRLELADVFRKHGPEYIKRFGGSLSSEQKRVLRAISVCRTKALGGHRERCTQCNFERNAYNSCRNRHCPKCQAAARAAWLDDRAAELLPVPYFHLVFTLPKAFRPLALQNKALIYGILFKAAWETMQAIAADPKHLGARIGMLAVLHSWSQNLMHHPHLHCVVPGGGLSSDGQRWIYPKKSRNAKKKFFAPVKVLSRVFRGKFIHHLKRAFRDGEIQFHGELAGLEDPHEFEDFITRTVRTDWIVFCKRPFGGPQQVLKYLARYTHRVAISNNRLVGMDDERVHFRWKDYAHGNEQKIMPLSSDEFIRRFLLHVLPARFVRIRHYGFLSNRTRKEQLERCRQLLGVKEDGSEVETKASTESSEDQDKMHRCPKCQEGKMAVVGTLDKESTETSDPIFMTLIQMARPAVFDTS